MRNYYAMKQQYIYYLTVILLKWVAALKTLVSPGLHTEAFFTCFILMRQWLPKLPASGRFSCASFALSAKWPCSCTLQGTYFVRCNRLHLRCGNVQAIWSVMQRSDSPLQRATPPSRSFILRGQWPLVIPPWGGGGVGGGHSSPWHQWIASAMITFISWFMHRLV